MVPQASQERWARGAMAGEIDEVKTRISVEAIIGRHVQLQRSGQHLRGRCPFHEERTPSFFVFLDSGNYKCFGCGESGDVFTFLMKIENLTFRESLERLADETGVSLRRGNRDPKIQAHLRALAGANEAACRYFERQLTAHREGEEARDYLRKRGITVESQTRFRIGLAPSGWDGLINALRAQGVSGDVILAAGLARAGERDTIYDAFRSRLMFPIRSPKSTVLGFGGRTLGDDPAKYINTASTEIFDKSRLLYGLDLARESVRKSRSVVIVEGYTDVIAAHQAGFGNVVASMGTSLTERQFKGIASGVDEVVLCMDGDLAGRAAGRRNLQRIDQDLGSLTWHEGQLDAEIKVVELPAGKDPDQIISHQPGQWPAIIAKAKPLADYLFAAIVAESDISSRRGRAQALSEALRYIARLGGGDPVVRADYVAALAKKLSISESVIERELAGRDRRMGSGRPNIGAPAAAANRSVISVDDQLCALAMANPALLRQAIGRETLPIAALGSAEARSVFELLGRVQSSEPASSYLAERLGEDLGDYLEHLQTITRRHPAPASEQLLLADLGRLVLQVRKRHLSAEMDSAVSLLAGGADAETREKALGELEELRRERLAIERQLRTLAIST